MTGTAIGWRDAPASSTERKSARWTLESAVGRTAGVSGSRSCSPAAAPAAPTRSARWRRWLRRSPRAAMRPTSSWGPASARSTERSSRRARDDPLEATAAAGVEMWRELRWGDALRPLVSPSELGRLLGAAATLARLPGADLHGLLDPSPLRGTLERLVDFKQIARNVDGRHADGRRRRGHGLHDDAQRGLPSRRPGPRPRLGARDRLLRDPADARARARLGGDPGRVPGGRDPPPARGEGLVRRRRRAPERAAEAGARAGRRPRRRDRPELVGDRRRARRRGPTRSTAPRSCCRSCSATRSPTTSPRWPPSTRRSCRPDPQRAAPATPPRRSPRTIPYIFIAPQRSPRDRAPGPRRLQAPLRRHRRPVAQHRPRAARAGRRAPSEAPSTASCSATCSSHAQFIEELIELGRRDAERWLELATTPGCGRSGGCPRSRRARRPRRPAQRASRARRVAPAPARA